MPSMLPHFLMGKFIFRHLMAGGLLVPSDEAPILMGSELPDLIQPKARSHFYEELSGWQVPCYDAIQWLLQRFLRSSDPLLLGASGHLYLDRRYALEFLAPSLEWDVSADTVRQPRTGETWRIPEFFGRSVLYQEYTDLNIALLQSGEISLEQIWKLPDDFPQTGIAELDTHRAKSWREELEGYLKTAQPHRGRIIDCAKLQQFLETVSEDFAALATKTATRR